jgi:hypothetical protein
VKPPINRMAVCLITGGRPKASEAEVQIRGSAAALVDCGQEIRGY